MPQHCRKINNFVCYHCNSKKIPKNHTLLGIVFLVSPLSLPIATAWLVGKVQALRYTVQDAVHG